LKTAIIEIAGKEHIGEPEISAKVSFFFSYC
jgi:hypothetical protein